MAQSDRNVQNDDDKVVIFPHIKHANIHPDQRNQRFIDQQDLIVLATSRHKINSLQSVPIMSCRLVYKNMGISKNRVQRVK